MYICVSGNRLFIVKFEAPNSQASRGKDTGKISLMCLHGDATKPEVKLARNFTEHEFLQNHKPKVLNIHTMSSTKMQYLIAYNSFSAVLWLGLLVSTLYALSIHGYTSTYTLIGTYAQRIQTLAVLEILHSASGTTEIRLSFYNPANNI